MSVTRNGFTATSGASFTKLALTEPLFHFSHSNLFAAMLTAAAVTFLPDNAGASSTFFDTPTTISAAGDSANLFTMADLDGDGDQDIVSASNLDSEIYLYVNPGRQGTDWQRQVVVDSTSPNAPSDIKSLFTTEWIFGGRLCVLYFDGDAPGTMYMLDQDRNLNFTEHVQMGWMDGAVTDAIGFQVPFLKTPAIVYASTENEIAVQDNTFTRRINTDSGNVPAMALTDMNSDNIEDLVFVSDDRNGLYWTQFQNGMVETKQIIEANGYLEGIDSLAVGKTGLNGAAEFIVASSTGLGIFRVHRNFADPSTWYATPIDYTPGVTQVEVADLDHDGIEDIIFSTKDSAQPLMWKKGVEQPVGTFWAPPQVVSGPDNPVSSFQVIDIENDGDLDIISARSGEGGGLLLHRNPLMHGQPGFEPASTLFPESMSVYASGDFDGNGREDLVCAEYSGKIVVHKNDPVNGWSSHVVATESDTFLTDVVVGDIDNDGDLDIVSGEFDYIHFYENTSRGETWTKHVVGSIHNEDVKVYGLQDLTLEDIDGDRHLDIVYTSSYTGISWLEQVSPTRWNRWPVGWNYQQSHVATGDIDNDGDMDVVAYVSDAGATNYRIKWYENDPSIGSGSTKNFAYDAEGHLVRSLSNSCTFLHVDDINGDGQQDIAYRVNNQGVVFCYGRDDNAGWDLTGTMFEGYIVAMTDMNRDGRPDLVAWYNGDGTNALRVFQNKGGAHPDWQSHLYPDVALRGQHPVDVDGDGYLDIVTKRNVSGADHLVWYKNKPVHYTFNVERYGFGNLANGEERAIMSIELNGYNQAGDPPIVIDKLKLRLEHFDGTDWQPLTAQQANAIIDRLSIAVEKGGVRYVYEPTKDPEVVQVEEFQDDNFDPAGVLTIPMDGQEYGAVGNVRRFYVVLRSTEDAGSHTPNSCRITHLTEEGPVHTTAINYLTDAVLTPQFTPNVSTNGISLPVSLSSFSVE